ncbi:MAG: hypothetical protein ACKOT0_10245 [bacterium]
MARLTVGSLGTAALAAGLLMGTMPATQAAEGTLTFLPTEGTGDTGFSVQTSGGCANPLATHFIITMSGAGLTESNNITGVTELATIGATPAQVAPMTSPVSKILDTVKAENGGILPDGGYTISFVCREKMTTAALATFSAMITVTNGAGGALAWKEGFTPAPTPIVNTGKPKVTGKKKVGEKLTVSNGQWSPRPASYAYAWKLDGRTVGTARSITVTKAMKGKTLRVTVTATKSGYADGTVTVRIPIP